MTETRDQEQIAPGVRRAVGVAALRRLRRLVDAEQAQDRADAEAIKRVIIFLLVLIAAAAGLVLLTVSPRFLA